MFSVSVPLGDSKWEVTATGNEQVDVKHPDGTSYTLLVFGEGVILLGGAVKRDVKLSKTLFKGNKELIFKEESDAPSKADNN